MKKTGHAVSCTVQVSFTRNSASASSAEMTPSIWNALFSLRTSTSLTLPLHTISSIVSDFNAPIRKTPHSN